MKATGIFLILLSISFAGVAFAKTAVRLEAEELVIVGCSSGEASPVNFTGDGYAEDGAFSGDQTLFWRDAEEPGAILQLNLPAEKKGRYQLVLRLGKYRTFGKFQFMVNNKPVSGTIDLFGFPEKDEVVPFSVNLGEVMLNEGDNLLAMKLLGTNDNTVMPNHGACIDWVELTFREQGSTITSGGGTGETTGTGGTTGTAKTIEADEMTILRCTSGEAQTRNLAEEDYANEGTFTGDQSLQWHDADSPGALLELEFQVDKKGRYAIMLSVAKYRTYGIHQFLLNGKPMGKTVDMFGNPEQDIVTSFTVNLGEVNLPEGANKLGIKLTGTNPETIMANHGAGLDWIKLTPVAQPATTTKTVK